MEAEKYQITDKDGNEVLADVSGSLFDFIQECERMISLYKNQRYTQAEQLRDKLSERLDDVMRCYSKLIFNPCTKNYLKETKKH